VSVIGRHRSWLLLPAVISSLFLLPRPADAQGRRGRGPAARTSIVVIAGHRYSPYWYYDPWFQWGYPYPPYGYVYDTTGSIRLQVTPRDAQVFVDGYAAGTVDDFDGVFQRLRVRPGGHQIAIYLQGYRTIVQNVYAAPGSDQKIHLAMEPLGPGEVSDAPPPASEQPQAEGPGSEGPPAIRQGPRRPMPPPQDGPRRERSARFGSLSLRVQPADAEILVDGERWTAPAEQDRIRIELSEGRHHIEVRKDGFSPYSEDVLIRAGATMTLNVALPQGDGR
jgi:hypothetical protein